MHEPIRHCSRVASLLGWPFRTAIDDDSAADDVVGAEQTHDHIPAVACSSRALLNSAVSQYDGSLSAKAVCFEECRCLAAERTAPRQD